MKKKRNDFVLIHTKWWSGVYLNKKLIMQTKESPNSLYNIRDVSLEPGALGSIKRYVNVEYFGILPASLDHVKVPVWDKDHKNILRYKKVCP